MSEEKPVFEEQPTEEELAAARQEEYYWHCIAEFYGCLRVFGAKKVLQDLETFKQSVEKPKSNLILPNYD